MEGMSIMLPLTLGAQKAFRDGTPLRKVLAALLIPERGRGTLLQLLAART